MLSYPRGYGYRGGIASRGPYRKNNQFVPELKNYDIDEVPPFFAGSGDMNGALTWADTLSTWGSPTQNGAGINNAAVMSRPLNDMPQDTSANGRLGTRIWCKKIYLTIVINMARVFTTSFSPQAVNVRCMLVLDKQPNLAKCGKQAFEGNNTPSDPLISAILQPVNYSNAVTRAMPNSPMSLDNRDRFRVLYDYHGSLRPNGIDMINIEKVIPLKFFTQFGSGGGIVSNQIFLLFLSDGYVTPTGAAATTETRALFKFMSRLRFTDP